MGRPLKRLKVSSLGVLYSELYSCHFFNLIQHSACSVCSTAALYLRPLFKLLCKCCVNVCRSPFTTLQCDMSHLQIQVDAIDQARIPTTVVSQQPSSAYYQEVADSILQVSLCAQNALSTYSVLVLNIYLKGANY